MLDKHRIALLTIIALLVVAVIYVEINDESFANKEQKADTIYTWFKSHPDPTYTDYSADIGSSSNVVEYEDIRSLGDSITKQRVSQIIR